MACDAVTESDAVQAVDGDDVMARKDNVVAVRCINFKPKKRVCMGWKTYRKSIGCETMGATDAGKCQPELPTATGCHGEMRTPLMTHSRVMGGM